MLKAIKESNCAFCFWPMFAPLMSMCAGNIYAQTLQAQLATLPVTQTAVHSASAEGFQSRSEGEER